MASTNEKICHLLSFLGMLVYFRIATATNIDCGGRPFHCVNSTHFMICVDLGAGVSKTVDDFVIQCPSTTVCREKNLFECEYQLPTTTETTILQGDENTKFEISTQITTVSPFQKNTVTRLLSEYINTISPSTQSDVTTDTQTQRTSTVGDLRERSIDVNDISSTSDPNLTTTGTPKEDIFITTSVKTKSANKSERGLLKLSKDTLVKKMTILPFYSKSGKNFEENTTDPNKSNILDNLTINYKETLDDTSPESISTDSSTLNSKDVAHTDEVNLTIPTISTSSNLITSTTNSLMSDTTTEVVQDLNNNDINTTKLLPQDLTTMTISPTEDVNSIINENHVHSFSRIENQTSAPEELTVSTVLSANATESNISLLQENNIPPVTISESILMRNMKTSNLSHNISFSLNDENTNITFKPTVPSTTLKLRFKSIEDTAVTKETTESTVSFSTTEDSNFILPQYGVKLEMPMEIGVTSTISDLYTTATKNATSELLNRTMEVNITHSLQDRIVTEINLLEDVQHFTNEISTFTAYDRSTQEAGLPSISSQINYEITKELISETTTKSMLRHEATTLTPSETYSPISTEKVNKNTFGSVPVVFEFTMVNMATANDAVEAKNGLIEKTISSDISVKLLSLEDQLAITRLESEKLSSTENPSMVTANRSIFEPYVASENSTVGSLVEITTEITVENPSYSSNAHNTDDLSTKRQKSLEIIPTKEYELMTDEIKKTKKGDMILFHENYSDEPIPITEIPKPHQISEGKVAVGLITSTYPFSDTLNIDRKLLYPDPTEKYFTNSYTSTPESSTTNENNIPYSVNPKNLTLEPATTVSNGSQKIQMGNIATSTNILKIDEINAVQDQTAQSIMGIVVKDFYFSSTEIPNEELIFSSTLNIPASERDNLTIATDVTSATSSTEENSSTLTQNLTSEILSYFHTPPGFVTDKILTELDRITATTPEENVKVDIVYFSKVYDDTNKTLLLNDTVNDQHTSEKNISSGSEKMVASSNVGDYSLNVKSVNGVESDSQLFLADTRILTNNNTQDSKRKAVTERFGFEPIILDNNKQWPSQNTMFITEKLMNSEPSSKKTNTNNSFSSQFQISDIVFNEQIHRQSNTTRQHMTNLNELSLTNDSTTTINYSSSTAESNFVSTVTPMDTIIDTVDRKEMKTEMPPTLIKLQSKYLPTERYTSKNTFPGETSDHLYNVPTNIIHSSLNEDFNNETNKNKEESNFSTEASSMHIIKTHDKMNNNMIITEPVNKFSSTNDAESTTEVNILASQPYAIEKFTPHFFSNVLENIRLQKDVFYSVPSSIFEATTFINRKEIQNLDSTQSLLTDVENFDSTTDVDIHTLEYTTGNNIQVSNDFIHNSQVLTNTTTQTTLSNYNSNLYSNDKFIYNDNNLDNVDINTVLVGVNSTSEIINKNNLLTTPEPNLVIDVPPTVQTFGSGKLSNRTNDSSQYKTIANDTQKTQLALNKTESILYNFKNKITNHAINFELKSLTATSTDTSNISDNIFTTIKPQITTKGIDETFDNSTYLENKINVVVADAVNRQRTKETADNYLLGFLTEASTDYFKDSTNNTFTTIDSLTPTETKSEIFENNSGTGISDIAKAQYAKKTVTNSGLGLLTPTLTDEINVSSTNDFNVISPQISTTSTGKIVENNDNFQIRLDSSTTVNIQFAKGSAPHSVLGSSTLASTDPLQIVALNTFITVNPQVTIGNTGNILENNHEFISKLNMIANDTMNTQFATETVGDSILGLLTPTSTEKIHVSNSNSFTINPLNSTGSIKKIFKSKNFENKVDMEIINSDNTQYAKQTVTHPILGSLTPASIDQFLVSTSSTNSTTVNSNIESSNTEKIIESINNDNNNFDNKVEVVSSDTVTTQLTETVAYSVLASLTPNSTDKMKESASDIFTAINPKITIESPRQTNYLQVSTSNTDKTVNSQIGTVNTEIIHKNIINTNNFENKADMVSSDTVNTKLAKQEVAYSVLRTLTPNTADNITVLPSNIFTIIKPRNAIESKGKIFKNGIDVERSNTENTQYAKETVTHSVLGVLIPASTDYLQVSTSNISTTVNSQIATANTERILENISNNNNFENKVDMVSSDTVNTQFAKETVAYSILGPLAPQPTEKNIVLAKLLTPAPTDQFKVSPSNTFTTINPQDATDSTGQIFVNNNFESKIGTVLSDIDKGEKNAFEFKLNYMSNPETPKTTTVSYVKSTTIEPLSMINSVLQQKVKRDNPLPIKSNEILKKLHFDINNLQTSNSTSKTVRDIAHKEKLTSEIPLEPLKHISNKSNEQLINHTSLPQINITKTEHKKHKSQNTTNVVTKRDNSTAKNVLFTCKYRLRGRYVDENDCRKFYICIGRTLPLIGECPVNTVFSEIKKQCTKNLSHCIRHNQFRCVQNGRFVDVLKSNVYYICVKNNNTYVRFQLQCQNGYNLNKKSVKCVSNVNTQQLSSTSIDNDSNKASDQSTIEGKSKEMKVTVDEEKNICKKEGKFPDPQDCRKYYVCSKNSKSVFRRRTKKCDSDEVFHPEKKKCVDSDSYECN